MYFNDSSNQDQSICHQVDDILKTNTTSYSLNAKTRSANQWLRKVGVASFRASGTWEYDDSNNTGLPIATTDLVTDQSKYQMPSAILKIERIERSDSDDNWHTIEFVDRKQIGSALDEFLDTSGEPKYADIFADQIKLYPAPDYDKTNGLKLYYSRDIHKFESDDTTAEPGIPKPFHRILVFGMCYDFAIQEGWSEKARIFKGELNQMFEDLKRFYSDRPKRAFSKRIRPFMENYK